MNKKFFMTTLQAAAGPTAAPVWESIGTAVSNQGTSIDVPYPSTVDAEDCFCLLVVKWGLQTFTEPTDWDTVSDAEYAAQATVAIYITIAVGDETGNLTVETDSGDFWNHAIMARFSGVNTSSMYEAFADAGIINDTTINIPAITTLGDFRLALVFIMIAGVEDPSACTNYIEIFDENLTSGTPDTTFVGEVQDADSEGEVDADSCTISPTRSHIVFTLALKPVT